MVNISDYEFNEPTIHDEDKILPKKFWKVGIISSMTQEKFGYCIDNLYIYDIFNNKCKRDLARIDDKDVVDEEVLDRYMWESLTEYVEESRVLVYETYLENGVNECESYFLSLKFLWSTLKKLRNKLFSELDNREDYDRTPLKISVNFLIRRIERIMAKDEYRFSKEAANGRLSQFKKEASWEVLRYLVEDAGIIFHAKLTL